MYIRIPGMYIPPLAESNLNPREKWIPGKNIFVLTMCRNPCTMAFWTTRYISVHIKIKMAHFMYWTIQLWTRFLTIQKTAIMALTSYEPHSTLMVNLMKLSMTRIKLLQHECLTPMESGITLPQILQIQN